MAGFADIIEKNTQGAISAIIKELDLPESELIKAFGGRYKLLNFVSAPRRWGRESLRKLYRLWLANGHKPDRFLELLLIDEY
jgi:hypothetical protein